MGTPYQLQNSKIVGNSLIFENGDNGFIQALQDGFFFLKTPDTCDVSSGDLFAQNFYKDKEAGFTANEFRGFKCYTEAELAKHEGYFCRDVDQTEQFFLERRFWDTVYPTDLAELANSLKEISLVVLRNILARLDIPKNIWSKATGGCSEDRGLYHLTFNHFRPEVPFRGLNTHKDSGWVTILRSIEPGLEAHIQNKWVSVQPKERYFIVNFGCAFEILTKHTDYPVSAVTHRVVQQQNAKSKPDRFSYALFADNSLDKKISEGLYEYTYDKQLKLKVDFQSFLDNILMMTYQENTVGLY